MSATEVIEQIEKLEPGQKQEVVAHLLQAFVATIGSPEGNKLFEAMLRQYKHEALGNDSLIRRSTSADHETFEKVTRWALDEHRELLSRLAK